MLKHFAKIGCVSVGLVGEKLTFDICLLFFVKDICQLLFYR
jgi:hypothetical protein